MWQDLNKYIESVNDRMSGWMGEWIQCARPYAVIMIIYIVRIM